MGWLNGVEIFRGSINDKCHPWNMQVMTFSNVLGVFIRLRLVLHLPGGQVYTDQQLPWEAGGSQTHFGSGIHLWTEVQPELGQGNRYTITKILLSSPHPRDCKFGLPDTRNPGYLGLENPARVFQIPDRVFGYLLELIRAEKSNMQNAKVAIKKVSHKLCTVLTMCDLSAVLKK